MPKDNDNQTRMLRAVGAMPYGGIVHTKLVRTADFFTAESIVEYLQELQDVLKEVDTDRVKDEAELAKHKRIVSGLKEFVKLVQGA